MAAPGSHLPIVTLLLAGDVMTGRGIDQILAHPSAPELYEGAVRDARDYVALAERASGPVPRGVAADYVWGDALAEAADRNPVLRLVNLETSVTTSDRYEPKGINYRMHPANVDCLRAARVDVCTLANNHVLDYGRDGLLQTIETLERAGIGVVGAGRDYDAAARPLAQVLPAGGRVVVGACAHESSGVPRDWTASATRPGVHVVEDLSADTAAALAARVTQDKQAGDVAVVSIHWGGNWGYDVPRRWVDFAHRLVDGGVDVVHGHSSHHVRPIEVYRGRLVLYGCGDLLNDYEGITGYERYRDDLVLMYIASVSRQTGRLDALELVPLQIRHLRLNRPAAADVRWIAETVDAISAPFDTRIALTAQGSLRWTGGAAPA
jgi:poly-gamma-glutamate synthesis protein (capsule biosynthesis protein)